MRWARLGALVMLLTAPAAAQDTPLELPPGFRIEAFARDLNGARFMVLDPGGTLLLSIPRESRVVALRDGNRDGRADRMVVIAQGLNHRLRARPAPLRLGGLVLQSLQGRRRATRRHRALRAGRLRRAPLRHRASQRGGDRVPARHRRALGHRERARLEG